MSELPVDQTTTTGIDAWAPRATAPPVPAAEAGTVALVGASTFCISGLTGDVAPDRAHGLFLADTRMLSRWELTVDGHPVEVLSFAHADSGTGDARGAVVSASRDPTVAPGVFSFTVVVPARSEWTSCLS
jgi:hypothetical protein